MGSPTWNHTMTAACLSVKFLASLSNRFGPIYAVFCAVALHVDTSTYLTTIGLASLATMATILVAPLVDVLQPHRLFLFGECCVLLGFFLALMGSSSIQLIGVAWFLFVSGNSINNACIQTVVSSSVHSSSLGRVTGIIEAGWPLSSLLGLPLVGVVLKRASWTAWFSLLLSLHALAGLFLLRQFTLLRERQQKEDRLPGKNDSTESEKLTNQSKNSSYSSSTSAATSSTPSPSTFSPSPSILSIITDSLTHFRAVLSHVPALITIFLGMTMSCLTTLNNASLGLWLESAHDMDSEGVGSLSLVMGGGELLAAALVAKLVDRIGLIRAVGFGAAGCVVAQLLLALLAGYGLAPGLLCYGLAAVASEFTLVSIIGFVSSGMIFRHSIQGQQVEVGGNELEEKPHKQHKQPASNGTFVSLFFCCFSVGAMFAMQLLTPLYQLQGLLTVSLFQAALILFTILVFFRTLRRYGLSTSESTTNREINQLDLPAPELPSDISLESVSRASSTHVIRSASSHDIVNLQHNMPPPLSVRDVLIQPAPAVNVPRASAKLNARVDRVDAAQGKIIRTELDPILSQIPQAEPWTGSDSAGRSVGSIAAADEGSFYLNLVMHDDGTISFE